MNPAPAVVWFRRDLRLGDNPALAAAALSGRPVVPLFVLPAAGECRALGAASRWWLHRSLRSLAADIASLGSQLVLRHGPANEAVLEVATGCGAAEVHWNRRYEGPSIATDRRIKESLLDAGIPALSHNGSLLAETADIRTLRGGPYKVFTPFWNAWRRFVQVSEPAARPPVLATGPQMACDRLEDWGLLPQDSRWAATLEASWTPGEHAARRALDAFAAATVDSYADRRDFPAAAGTSRLSPHLAWGEISPRQALHAAASSAERHGAGARGPESWIRQLAWREFHAHLLYHFPTMPDRNWRQQFDRFPWVDDGPRLAAWQRGLTGYPIVDAGMRELRETGWMHNRVRMIAASFLVKDLLIDWRAGEAWFWERLVDADAANNAGNWQWIAGTGADAAPYFRIFNPATQGERFDGEGRYVRRWVPELARLAAPRIHRPWTAPRSELRKAGVELGRSYPHRIVDHAKARLEALASLRSLQAVG